MNIFFDMDYTLLAVDGSLRPKVREVLQRLKDDGHQLYVWSAMASGGWSCTDTAWNRW